MNQLNFTNCTYIALEIRENIRHWLHKQEFDLTADNYKNATLGGDQAYHGIHAGLVNLTISPSHAPNMFKLPSGLHTSRLTLRSL